VDVFFELVKNGENSPMGVYGGHGDIGLTSDREPSGRPHLVLWNPESVGANELIQIRVQAQDDFGDPGPFFKTPAFTLGDGLPPL
jgi:hypothetical protein